MGGCVALPRLLGSLQRRSLNILEARVQYDDKDNSPFLKPNGTIPTCQEWTSLAFDPAAVEFRSRHRFGHDGSVASVARAFV